MIKFIIGFILGCLFMFLFVGASVIVKDEKRIRHLKRRRLGKVGDR